MLHLNHFEYMYLQLHILSFSSIRIILGEPIYKMFKIVKTFMIFSKQDYNFPYKYLNFKVVVAAENELRLKSEFSFCSIQVQDTLVYIYHTNL